MDKNASLGAQAAALKRSIQNREQRRAAEKVQRYAAAEATGEYGDREGARRAPVSTGQNQVQRLAEISALSASRPVETFRCDVCKATFPSEAQYQQHLHGPVHRKAMDKLAQEQLQRQRRAIYQDMTESALGAAAWQAGHGVQQQQQQQQRPPPVVGHAGSAPPSRQAAASTGGGPSGQPAGAAQGGGSGRGRGRGGRGDSGAPGSGGRGGGGGDGGSSRPRNDVMSHEEMVAAATKSDEPLTIDGWAPPTVTLQLPKEASAQQQQPVDAKQQQSGAALQGQGHGQAVVSREGGAGRNGADSDGGDDGRAGAGMLGLVEYGSDSGEGDDRGSSNSASSSDDDQGDAKPFTGSFF